MEVESDFALRIVNRHIGFPSFLLVFQCREFPRFAKSHAKAIAFPAHSDPVSVSTCWFPASPICGTPLGYDIVCRVENLVVDRYTIHCCWDSHIVGCWLELQGEIEPMRFWIRTEDSPRIPCHFRKSLQPMIELGHFRGNQLASRRVANCRNSLGFQSPLGISRLNLWMSREQERRFGVEWELSLVVLVWCCVLQLRRHSHAQPPMSMIIFKINHFDVSDSG